ncbi:multidrug efflux MFS transporter [Paenibacillus sp. SC116]|uniref:MDR family MFS transporter n=1 Tax=Paenibacillus sp. SC116 TaxID=2968986 RepID=UPI00215ADA70|nr:MDR family MFS transporter [Paenibacillus sp. SC116]MCR8842181.1 multidrug efflux MFS transporter [Paenibacillus sp. SC116]
MSAWLNPRKVMCIVYVAAMFVVAMDATVLNVALQTISQELNVPPAASGILNVGYLVSLAIVLPMAGWLGDRWGTKRTFLLALAIFTSASALCSFAQDLTTLTIFRVIQGIGGGLLTPVGMAMLFRTFPPEERAKVSRSLILPIAIAPAIGPIVSGMLVEHFSWRWIFYVNLPIGIPALLFGLLLLKEHKQPNTGKLDVPGFLLSAPGLALLMYALSQGPIHGWSSPAVWGAGAIGIILLSVLVKVELSVSQPLLDLRLLGNRLFRTTGLVSMCASAGLLGMLYVFPLMYQNAWNASALDTGLTTFPEAIGLMIASQLVPWTYPRLGPKRVMVIGFVVTALIFVTLSMVDANTNPWFIRGLLFSVGIFLGQTVGSVQIAAFATIPPASMGRATTWFAVQGRLGPAIGLAVLSGILAFVGTSTVNAAGTIEPNLIAYRIALLAAAGFLILGACVALFIRDSDAAATIRKPVKQSASKKPEQPAAAEG